MGELGPRNSVLCRGDYPRREMGNFWGEHVPAKPNIPNNCELDWSIQPHTTRADAWLQGLDTSIIGRELGCTSGFLDDIMFFLQWAV